MNLKTSDLNPLREKMCSKIIFLTKHKDSYRYLKRKYIEDSQKQYSETNKEFIIPEMYNYLNQYGKCVYFLDYHTGKSVNFYDSKDNDYTPILLGTLIKEKYIKGIATSIMEKAKMDMAMGYVFLIMGISIGFILGAMLFPIIMEKLGGI